MCVFYLIVDGSFTINPIPRNSTETTLFVGQFQADASPAASPSSAGLAVPPADVKRGGIYPLPNMARFIAPVHAEIGIQPLSGKNGG